MHGECGSANAPFCAEKRQYLSWNFRIAAGRGRTATETGQGLEQLSGAKWLLQIFPASRAHRRQDHGWVGPARQRDDRNLAGEDVLQRFHRSNRGFRILLEV